MRAGQVSLIGGGQMAEAIVSALVKSDLVPASSIVVCDIHKARTDHFKKLYKTRVTNCPAEAAVGVRLDRAAACEC